MTVLCSLHDPAGFEHVRSGEPTNLTLRMRNTGIDAVRLSSYRGSPRGIVDFGASTADVTLDLMRAHGDLSARAGRGGTFELVPQGERWWFPKEVISVEFPDARIGGATGPLIVTIRFEGFGPEVDGRCEAVLMRLGPAGDAQPFVARWSERAQVTVGRGGNPPRGALSLLLDDPAAEARYYVALSSGNAPGFGALGHPGDAASLDVTAGEGWSASRVAGDPRAVWKIAAAEGAPPLTEIGLRSIVSRRKPGFAHVVLYRLDAPGAPDAFVVLPVALVNGSVRIVSFTANTTLLQNINEPTDVRLSWEVENASAVVLSTVGVVDEAQAEYPQKVEETTTFILTAYDSALDQIASSAVTVTVDPPLASRLVPYGTIALWKGSAADVPPHWYLCNGSNGTPNLVDRFIVGASSNNAHGKGEEDTHTHQTKSISLNPSTTNAGAHKHKFPSNWYQRNFEGGAFSSIDTNQNFAQNQTEVQENGSHSHTVPISIGATTTDPNVGSIRPPWYALCYIMKGA